jgi:transcriptional regulator with XRE-family HTH domain
MNMDFFDRIKDLVKQKTTFTLRAFIESMGLNYETYYSGKRRITLPRADEAQKIAAALGTTVEYLVTGKEPDASRKYRKALEEIRDITNKFL